MFCKNCGSEIENNAEFCGKCGTKVEVVPTYQGYVQTPGKSRIAAGILGIILGGFGAHNFYLGYTGKAVAQLLISLLSCGALAAVSSVWGIIEGILILTGSINCDASGTPLKY